MTLRVYLAVIIVIAVLMFVRRKKVYKNKNNNLDQLVELLQIEKSFPEINGWSASVDLLFYISNLILNKKDIVNIVECGSGISSLVIGYSLKKRGSGKLTTIESNKKYFDINKSLICEHKLDEYVKIIYAPIKKQKIEKKFWNWYETDCLGKIKEIDFLFIDGPVSSDPIKTNYGRYPALIYFWRAIKKEGIIILDDCFSKKNLNVCVLWKKKYTGLNFINLKTETKAYIFEKYDDN